MPHYNMTLNAGQSTGTKTVDNKVDPNIKVTNLSATSPAAFDFYRGHSPNPEHKPLGSGGDLDLYAEMYFIITCTAGQIQVDWDD